MKKGYRIPILSEFVQDFEFEYRKYFGGGSIGYIDYPSGKHIIFKKIRKTSKWLSMKVWWLPRTRKEALRTTTFDDGSTCTWWIHPMDKPFNIENMLKDNNIRVKING